MELQGKRVASGAARVITCIMMFLTAGAHAAGTVRDFGFVENVKTVAYVNNRAYDDDYIQLKGRIIRYLGGVYYIFEDQTGSIRVELDADKDWSFIRRDELVMLFGRVDRDYFSTEVKVYRAESLEHKTKSVRMGFGDHIELP